MSLLRVDFRLTRVATTFNSMERMNSRKYMKLRNPADNFDNDEASTSSLNKRDLKTRFNLEKLAWIGIGLLSIYFSNLHVKLLPGQWPSEAWKLPLWLAFASFGLFAGLFVYLNYFLPYFRGIVVTPKHWQRDAPVAVPAATISGFGAFGLLFLAFLPVYRWWSMLIFPAIFIGFFAFISIF